MRTPYPGTLDTARFRSAAGTPKVVVIVEGKRRQVIRRFKGGNEVWSASRVEILHDRGASPG